MYKIVLCDYSFMGENLFANFMIIVVFIITSRISKQSNDERPPTGGDCGRGLPLFSYKSSGCRVPDVTAGKC